MLNLLWVLRKLICSLARITSATISANPQISVHGFLDSLSHNGSVLKRSSKTTVFLHMSAKQMLLVHLDNSSRQTFQSQCWSLSVLLEKSITVALTDCRSMIKGSQQQSLMQYKTTKQKRTQRNEKRNYKASVHFVLALEFITTICILLPIKTVVIHTYISTTSYMYFSFKNKQTNK